MEKIQVQLKWPSFPGVHSLLLKGCTNPGTYEATIQALSRFTTLLDFTVIDPSQVSQDREKYDFTFDTFLHVFPFSIIRYDALLAKLPWNLRK